MNALNWNFLGQSHATLTSWLQALVGWVSQEGNEVAAQWVSDMFWDLLQPPFATLKEREEWLAADRPLWHATVLLLGQAHLGVWHFLWQHSVHLPEAMKEVLNPVLCLDLWEEHAAFAERLQFILDPSQSRPKDMPSFWATFAYMPARVISDEGSLFTAQQTPEAPIAPVSELEQEELPHREVSPDDMLGGFEWMSTAASHLGFGEEELELELSSGASDEPGLACMDVDPMEVDTQDIVMTASTHSVVCPVPGSPTSTTTDETPGEAEPIEITPAAETSNAIVTIPMPEASMEPQQLLASGQFRETRRAFRLANSALRLTTVEQEKHAKSKPEPRTKSGRVVSNIRKTNTRLLPEPDEIVLKIIDSLPDLPDDARKYSWGSLLIPDMCDFASRLSYNAPLFSFTRPTEAALVLTTRRRLYKSRKLWNMKCQRDARDRVAFFDVVLLPATRSVKSLTVRCIATAMLQFSRAWLTAEELVASMRRSVPLLGIRQVINAFIFYEWAERRVSDDDKRVVAYSLTPAARSFLTGKPISQFTGHEEEEWEEFMEYCHRKKTPASIKMKQEAVNVDGVVLLE